MVFCMRRATSRAFCVSQLCVVVQATMAAFSNNTELREEMYIGIFRIGRGMLKYALLSSEGLYMGKKIADVR